MALESQFSRSLLIGGGGGMKKIEKNGHSIRVGRKVKFRLQTTQNNKEIINQILVIFPIFLNFSFCLF